jgi:hypothetical protein
MIVSVILQGKIHNSNVFHPIRMYLTNNTVVPRVTSNMFVGGRFLVGFG